MRRALPESLSSWLVRYYRGPDHPGKIRLWRNFFRLTGLRLRIRYANKGWIALNPFEGLQSAILKYGHYEPEVSEAVLSQARADEVFWDVGANIGAVGVRVAWDDRIREVRCFEPHPGVFKDLAENIRLNSNRPLCAHPCALGEKSERTQLHEGGDSNLGASTLEKRHPSQASFWVSSVTMDELVSVQKLAPPSLVKVDVEGWEVGVLRGATWLLKNHPPRAWVIETKADERGNLAEEELNTLMTQAGYQCRRLQRSDGRIDPVENFLFTR